MITVRGNSGKRKLDSALSDVKYDYKYPDGLDLRPGSKLHDSIRDIVLDYAEASWAVMNRRHPYWKKIDNTLTAYITLDALEEFEKEKDARKPMAIVVPYSYATLETILTYFVTVFLESPIFRYDGFTTEDKIGSIMLEKVIELQCIRNKVGLALHTQLRDSLAYGFGVSSPIWDRKYGKVTTMGPDGVKIRAEEMLFEGNMLQNIDPYLYLPDPSVPIHEIQRGGFVGWINRTNYTEILGDEQYDTDLFNGRYVNHIDGRSSILISNPDEREEKVGGSSRNADYSELSAPVDDIIMYLNIIPKELELGKSEYPEKWLFILSGDQVVRCAKPVDLDHNMYPVGVCAPQFDGHSLTPVSNLELIYGLQEILDFMFTSHVANVRKAINDMLIVDPYLINMADLAKPGPGKLIRTRRAVWGRGVENAVKQLAVTDVTRNHMADVSVIMDVMQRSSGAVDSLMGIMRSGSERRSATESRDTRSGAVSRLQKSAKVASLMLMQDLAYMFASHTQQFMTMDTYVKIKGRYEEELIEEFGADVGGIKARPDQLLVNYDIVSSDGTTVNGDFADNWVQLFQTMGAYPAVGQAFDMVRVFKHIARMTGAKNVNDFVNKGGNVTTELMQDAQVASEVQAGNMVPIEEAGNVVG
jgi:hypothetical protein